MCTMAIKKNDSKIKKLGTGIFIARFGNGLELRFNEAEKGMIDSIIRDISLFDLYGIEITFSKGSLRTGPFSENVLSIVEKPSVLYIYNLLEMLRLSAETGFYVTSGKKIFHKSITLKKDILELPDGARFYLESIDPFTLVETYFFRLHEVDLGKGTVILDIGSEAGDTPIFFAKRGAKVYAVEPVLKNYKALLKNISLNKDIKKNITPIRVAVGQAGRVTMHFDPNFIDGRASAFYDKSRTSKEIVDSIPISALMKRFKLKKVDMIKMDSKGGEFFLKKDDLARVNRYIKIEYTATSKDHSVVSLLKTLSSEGFGYNVVNHNPRNKSLKSHGTIYAERIVAAKRK